MNEILPDLRRADPNPRRPNDSFNEIEPIVRTPEEAVDFFAGTKMDTLVLGKAVVAIEGGGKW